MIIFDWVLLAIAAVVILIQTYRGAKDMDLVFFEMIALLGAAKMSLQWCSQVSVMLEINKGIVLLIMFVIFSLVLLFIAGVVVKYAQFSLAPIDPWLSFIFGFITSWAIIFIFLRILLFVYPVGNMLKVPLVNKEIAIYEMIEKSEISPQIMEFKAFKAVGSFFNSVKLSQ